MDLAAKNQLITDWFYFTGGTALSEFYLHHRLSEDLDFFSETEFDQKIVDDFIRKVCQKIKAKSFKKSILGHAIVTLEWPDKNTLKIDFVHQPFKKLEQGKKYFQLQIASLWDIVVDKLYTIFHRANARDFVDLYFAMDEVGCDFEQLIKGMKEKYEMDFSKTDLLARLPIVKDLVDYPKMLIPFDPKKMENFFLKLAKDREGEIFK